MNPLLVKKKLGQRTQLLVCRLTEETGEAGSMPWHGPAWVGEKNFSPDDPYLFDTQLADAPYAGPGFSWRVRCPRGAWHFAFTVFDAAGRLVMGSLEFIRPMEMSGSVFSAVDLELDLYWLPDGLVKVVDEDELQQALAAGLMSAEEGQRVLEECEAARLAIVAGNYPWPLA